MSFELLLTVIHGKRIARYLNDFANSINPVVWTMASCRAINTPWYIRHFSKDHQLYISLACRTLCVGQSSINTKLSPTLFRVNSLKRSRDWTCLLFEELCPIDGERISVQWNSQKDSFLRNDHGLTLELRRPIDNMLASQLAYNLHRQQQSLDEVTELIRRRAHRLLCHCRDHHRKTC